MHGRCASSTKRGGVWVKRRKFRQTLGENTLKAVIRGATKKKVAVVLPDSRVEKGSKWGKKKRKRKR